MNHYEPESNGAMATAEPLFASVWLALYYGLRKSYIEHRSMKSASPKASHPQKRK